MASPTELTVSSRGRSFATRIERRIRERALIGPGERVLVAVSGGADSTCLLLTLATLRARLELNLDAAYFDHGLRGVRAGSRERRFVEQLCAALGVPLHLGSGDVRSLAGKPGRSLEEAARELRYRFLARTASGARCEAVATGHTKDDQAETVLLHLIRGTGLRGLSGMAEVASWPVRLAGAWKPRLVRPLLSCSRQETERCCREAGVTVIEDATNRSDAFQRNRIRRELLPLLRQFNPSIRDALARLAENVREDLAAVESLAGSLVQRRRHEVRLDRKALREAPSAVRAHAVRLAFAASAGDARALARRHVVAVLGGSTGSVFHLPRGVTVEVQRSVLRFSSGFGSGVSGLPHLPIALPVPGTVSAGTWLFNTEVVPAPNSLGEDPSVAHLDADACRQGLFMRRRRPGDRFHPLGMPSSKKLQDFFVDEHVPRSERDGVPLICAGNQIAWVVGQRPAEWAKLKAGAGWAVRVSARKAGQAGTQEVARLT